jgi:iron complex outermembrane receptor protein
MMKFRSTRKSQSTLFSRTGIVILAALCASPSTAQNSANKIIEEVIVTAGKSASSIQDIPIAVSSLSGEDLAFRGVADMSALQRTVPSLNYSHHNGVDLVTIRGVGLNIDLGGGEPAVASHINGIYQPRVTTGNIAMDDIERVEVLRGPQGTLYGRNATGGAINYILNRPTDTFEGKLNAGMGTFSGRDGKFTAVLSGPLVDDILNARAMANYAHDRGWIKDVVSGETLSNTETNQGRLSFSLFPQNSFSADLDVLYRKDRHLEPANVMIESPDPVLEAQLTIVPPSRATPDDYIEGSYRKVKLTRLPIGNRETLNAALSLEWDSDWGALKSLTGFQDHEIFRSSDQDTSARDTLQIIGWQDTSTSISQEFDFSVKGDWGHALLGVFFFKEDYFVTTPTDVPAAVGGQGLTVRQFANSTIESTAIFGDATFNLSDRSRAFGGLRYTIDNKAMVQTVILAAGGVPLPIDLLTSAGVPLPVNGCENLHTEQEYKRLNPRVGLQYDLSDDAMLYAQYQTGYKSGDTNFTNCGNSYQPEEVKSAELGLKSSWLERRLTINTAIFDNNYTNFQVFKIIGINGLVINAPKARVQGAELEALILPSDEFSFDIAATYLDAIYTEFSDTDPANPDPGEQDLAGNQLNRAPKFSVNLGMEYRTSLNFWGLAEARLRAEYFRTDDIAYRPYDGPLDKQAGFELFNAAISVSSTDNRNQLKIYGRNLSNAQYYDYIFAIQTGLRDGPTGQPRAFGIELSHNF